MKILEVDKIEIVFEKQHKASSCKWCVYCFAEKGEKSKGLFMIKLNKKPIVAFQECTENFVKVSKEVENEIKKNEK
tara:strand:- start:258 stop:485 length:228 start_codon:yes stop_codon:yes gene_type:complete